MLSTSPLVIAVIVVVVVVVFSVVIFPHCVKKFMAEKSTRDKKKTKKNPQSMKTHGYSGKLLDHYAKEHHIFVGPSWDNCQEQCYGDVCFKNIYFSLCGTTGLAIILAGILRFRLRNGVLSVNPRVASMFDNQSH